MKWPRPIKRAEAIYAEYSLAAAPGSTGVSMVWTDAGERRLRKRLQKIHEEVEGLVDALYGKGKPENRLDCVFCRIVSGQGPATILREWPDAVAIVPLNPVSSGHVLIIPRWHVEDVAYDPAVSGVTMRRAADFINEKNVGDCNVITSRGASATQTVFHLHVHIVPRREGDGLRLPWSTQAAIPYTKSVGYRGP